MIQRHDGAWRAATPGVASRTSWSQQRQSRPPARGAAAGAIVNWAGSALSLALLVGVGVWSYQLMIRDVSGVPVVQALSGPMRVAPDDPGGRRAAHQGLAVNAVAAEGQVEPVADTITLAPSPVALKPEDRVAARPTGQTGREPGVQETPRAGDASVHRSGGAASRAAGQEGDTGRLSEMALARSPVPPPRPGTLRPVAVSYEPRVGGRDDQAEALLEQLATRMAPERDIDIAPETLAQGTRLVQLGAYEEEAEARAVWATLADRFSAQFEGRGRVIEEAMAGGRRFFRLRVHGFADEPEARRFCAAFANEGVDCIPVLVR